MEKKELTNYNQSNIEAIDRFLADKVTDLDYLQRTYTMIQANTQNPVEITPESRKKCVDSLFR